MQNQGLPSCHSCQSTNHHHHLNPPSSHSIYYYITLPSFCCNFSCCHIKNKNKNKHDCYQSKNHRPTSPSLSSSLSSLTSSDTTSNETTTPSIKSITNSSNQHHQTEKTNIKVDDKKPYKVLSHAIEELYQTEENYIYDLSIMVEICIIVLQQQKWIIKEHIDILSRNIKDILYFHQELYDSFYKENYNQCYDPHLLDEQCKSIATSFLHFETKFMTLYIEYCHGHDDAWKLCTDYRNKPEWNEFIDQCQLMLLICQSSSKLSFSNKKNKRLIRFEDLLIKPIQRICRYQLLIKEIIRHGNQCFSSSSSQSLLMYSFKSMYDIATEIDKQNEIRDSHEKTNRFIQRLESDWRISKQLLAQLGCIIISGALEMTYQNQLTYPSPLPLEDDVSISAAKSKYYGCFIFNTYVIFIRPKKQTLYEPKHWFPLHLAEIIDNGNETEFILKCQQHTFHCKAACTQEKQIWLTKIQLAQEYQKQHSLLPPEGLVSSLNSDFLTSFASTSHHPSDIHSIYQSQQSDNHSQKLHRSNNVTNHHLKVSHPLIEMNHPFIDKNNKQKQASLLNKKRKSVILSLPMSTSSPSILLMNHNHELQYTEEDTREEEEVNNTHNQSPTTITATTAIHTKLAKMKHRHSSLDLFSMTKHRVSIHLKSQRKNSIRETVDQRLRDVCTKDYLSSRVRHFSGRKSSVHSFSTVSTPSSSPIHSLSLKNMQSSQSSKNIPIQNKPSSSTSLEFNTNRFSLLLLHTSPPTTTFMDDPSLTFTSSPMKSNDTHQYNHHQPTTSHFPSTHSSFCRLPISYSLPLNIHQNVQDTTTNNLSNQNNMDRNHPIKRRSSLFLSSFQLSSTKFENKKSLNIFSKGFKWNRFFKSSK